ncbi:hypothetical protein Barb6_01985 [Bacteroidales bacterium Barb6]|nr:hypothetical protein Barb6_01985 [Bacteroidales bacterium Barb6]
MTTVKPFTVNHFSENTYLLHDDTGEAVVIDCGCYRPEEEQKLSNYIKQHKLTLKHNLCTHLHLDHTFGNGFVYRTYGLRPETHRSETEGAPTPAEQSRLFHLPEKTEDIITYKYIAEGESIRFGKSELTAILVPGHSPGGLVFYDKENGYLFSGDTLFAGSIGRSDLWGGNEAGLIATIKSKLLSLPDNTIVYPGHGPATSVIAEKKNNPYLK